MNNARRKQLAVAADYLCDTLANRADIEQAKSLAEKAKYIIDDMCSEEQDAFDNLPEGFQDGVRGQQMENNIMNMESAIDEIDDLDFTKEQSALEEDIYAIVGRIDL